MLSFMLITRCYSAQERDRHAVAEFAQISLQIPTTVAPVSPYHVLEYDQVAAQDHALI